MTTQAEKVALDVIWAALDALPGESAKARGIHKLAIVISMMVCLCKEQNIALEPLIDLITRRWADYDEEMRE